VLGLDSRAPAPSEQLGAAEPALEEAPAAEEAPA
jgi:hypothetical protein